MPVSVCPDRHGWHLAGNPQEAAAERLNTLLKNTADRTAIEAEEIQRLQRVLRRDEAEAEASWLSGATDGLTAALLASYTASDEIVLSLTANRDLAASTVESWIKVDAVNVRGRVPSLKTASDDTLSTELLAHHPTTIVTTSDQILEQTSFLYDLNSKSTSTVVLTLLASKQEPFSYHLDNLLAIRNIGLPILFAHSVQECYDMTVVAEVVSLTCQIPVIVAFDGLQLPSEVSNLQSLSFSSLNNLLNEVKHDVAQLSQSIEDRLKVFQVALRIVSKFSVKSYKTVELLGSNQGELTVVSAGPISSTIFPDLAPNVSLLSIRLLRPFDFSQLIHLIPTTTKELIAVNSSESPSSAVESDVVTALSLTNFHAVPLKSVFCTASQGLSGTDAKTLELRGVIKTGAIKDNSLLDHIEILDSTFNISDVVDRSTTFCTLLGQHGSLRAQSRLLTDVNAATRTISTNLVISKQENSVDTFTRPLTGLVVNDVSLLFLPQYKFIFESLAENSDVLLNCSWSPDQLEHELPNSISRIFIDRKTKIWLINATGVAPNLWSANLLIFEFILRILKSGTASQLRDPITEHVLFRTSECSDGALARNLDQFFPEPTILNGSLSDGVEETYDNHSACFVPVNLLNDASQQPDFTDLVHRNLLTRLFGDRIILADSTHAPSLFGEKYIPRTSTADVSKIFSDNMEYTFGIFLAREHRRQLLIRKVQQVLSQQLPNDLSSLLVQWQTGISNNQITQKLVTQIICQLEALQGQTSELAELWHMREYFAIPSRWILGNHNWARDIGFSGLHHIMASGQNVNVLIPETDFYTKSLESERSKVSTKKDIGLYAMSYGNVFVGSIAAHCNQEQAVKALLEADAFNGPSIILAYSPQPKELLPSQDITLIQRNESQIAVEKGLWPLFRWNPALEKLGREPFKLDSDRLRRDLEDFLSREAQLSLLSQDEPTLSSALAESMPQQMVRLQAQAELTAKSSTRKIECSLLILYGSDSGNGLSLAEKLSKKAQTRGITDIRCNDANSCDIDSLVDETNVVFILSTAGQGEFCGNAVQFWNKIKKSNKCLPNLKFAIFGLGDSHYWGKGTDDSEKYFCKPAKDLGEKLQGMGSQPLIELGLGDDQHENGYQGAWNDWHEELLCNFGATPVEGEEEPTTKVLMDENIKEESGYLRGHILRSLSDKSTKSLLPEDTKLTKFHGIYQQDDRDLRPQLEADGKERAYSFMVRVGIPGGVCTPEQYLLMDSLCESHANSTLKLTTRQAFQLHGVLKWNLKDSIKEINRALMDTLAACGDVCRNVMANPNPYQSQVHEEVLVFARKLSAHLKPQTTAYQEIWLDKKLVAGQGHVDVEPLYGASYLPRKFKVAIAVPPMNDVDVFAHCLGYIAIVEENKLVGWNISAGGGMGMTHGNTKTYPRLSDLLGFCTPDQAIKVGEAIMVVQRDNGDRVNRKHARLKYTIEDHGVAWYRKQVEDYCGFKLGEARPFKFDSNNDRFGWSEGTDGNFHYGMFIENGRVRDTDEYQLKSALKELASIHTGDFRLTANQNIIIGAVTPAQRPVIQELLERYNIGNERHSGLRLSSIACVALPTCGLAMAESERYLPLLIDKLDQILSKNNILSDSIVIRMSGCPNGCSRPFVAEIALVGKAPGSYNLYLGGGFSGNRLAKIYREAVNEEQILEILDEMITLYAKERQENEHFGDFVIRKQFVAPTLAGRLFHEEDIEANKIETPSGTNQIYW